MNFNPDRFSDSGPHWTKIDTIKKKDNLDLLNLIASNYSHYYGKLENIYRVTGPEVNSSNLLIEGSVRKFVIKLINQNELSNFKTQTDLYGHIKNMNLPAPYLISSEFTPSLPHFALDYIKGEYFSGSKKDLELTAKSVNFFHDGFKNYDKSKLLKWDVLQQNSSNILNNFYALKDEWGYKFGSEIELKLQKNIDLIFDTEASCSNNIDQILKIEESIFHIDLHPHNIIIGNGIANIIDIDSLRVARWPTALGFGFFKLVRQALVNQGIDNLDYSDIAVVFKEMSANINTGENKWELLFSGALTEILKRLLTIFEGNLGGQISPWNKTLLYQIDALSEIHFLASKFNTNRL